MASETRTPRQLARATTGFAVAVVFGFGFAAVAHGWLSGSSNAATDPGPAVHAAGPAAEPPLPIQAQAQAPADSDSATPQAPPAGPAGPGLLAQLDDELAQLADAAQHSVVMITSHKELDVPFRSAVPPGYPTTITVPVTYSGVIVDADGFVLTLADAMEGSRRIRLHLPDGREVPAEPWGVDPRSNLGVLRILDAHELRLQAAILADSSRVRRGQFVMTCGSPFGLQGTTSTGRVTGTNRLLRVDGHDHVGILQIDATVNPGDPGGAAFNVRGELIGIIWATFGHSGVSGLPSDDASTGPGGLPNLPGLEDLEGLDLRAILERFFPGSRNGNGNGNDSDSDSNSGDNGRSPNAQAGDDGPITAEEIERLWQRWVNHMYRVWAERRNQRAFLNAYGINFVLPSNVAGAIARELIEHREVRRAQLGLRVLQLPHGGLRVEDVVADGPAAAAGVEIGDEIVAVNGEAIRYLADIQRFIVGAVPGQTLRLRVHRNGSRHDLLVTLRAAAE